MLNKLDEFRKDMDHINNNNKKPIYNLEVTPTRKCDMACTYCFEAVDVAQHQTDFTNPDEQLQHIIDKVDYMLDDNEFREVYGGIHLGFWGGQLTLNPSFFDKIIKTFSSNDAVSFHMYTNGYNHRPIQSTLDWMIENKYQNKISIQVSYDGEPVNSLNRILINGKTTGDTAIGTAESLIQQGFKLVSIKATLRSSDLKHLSEVWDSFEKLYYRFKKYGANILYAPTIDYTQDIERDYVKDFKEQTKLIAKKEVEFFKKENKHLWVWFNSEKSICNAGSTMGAIDIDGNLYVCHGAFYDDYKNQMLMANVKDDGKDFVKSILTTRKNITSCDMNNQLPDKCKGCEATYCANCNVENFEMDDKEKTINKDEWNKIWFARIQKDRTCEIFKYFGKINVAVNHLIKEK